ncbi:hypothetical protein [Alkalibacter saccharofermentans]|uniref:Uncharacterized protein n=1 Tax=Alkalibacter saccharofermentans DSM 14828 TaxID=1120975 RepID=A0A1M4S8K5_9FIRM|nr:hypothetical protein [Alkalibacter saccharofermentans]SHE28530.1 hypothetical protein SAMN02746064_00153 [Alkalibacter saccharofermentans DSM 14828]
MNLKSQKASTYIEIIISLFIIGLISITFMGSLGFAISSLEKASKGYGLIMESEQTLNELTGELRTFGREEMTDETAAYMEGKYTSDAIVAEINSRKGAEGLYTVKIYYKAPNLNTSDFLLTKVYLK